MQCVAKKARNIFNKIEEELVAPRTQIIIALVN